MLNQGLLQPGTVLQDTYEVLRPIGEGGMGVVHEGIQLRLGKRVAIKVMARELAANREALSRFRREAEVTSQLGHPHLVQVFDFGVAATGEPYFVMELLEGEDLEARLRRVGRLSLAEAAAIVTQVASALTAAHARGVVHRDLKPANVFLVSAEGMGDFVKVLDFGISKAKAAASSLTHGSIVMGTPQYMAPEQARGKADEIDPRSDQWALACIAWEMVAGRPAFAGEDIPSLLFQIVHEEPASFAAEAELPDLPVALEGVLRRALAKDRAHRFPNVKSFAEGFERAVPHRPPADAPVQAPRRRASAPETLAYGAQHPSAYGDADTAREGASWLKARDPRPRLTTLSRSAAEIVRPLRILANRRWWFLAGGAGVASLIFAGVALVSRPDSPRAPSAVPLASSRPRPMVVPLASSPPPTPATSFAPVGPPFEPAGGDSPRWGVRGERIRAHVDPAPEASGGRPAGNAARVELVDPFETTERRAIPTEPASAPFPKDHFPNPL
jgi:serine/threonine protein kinase